MAKPTADKTKTEIVHTMTINEIHMIPGRVDIETDDPACEVIIRASSSDPEQEPIHVPVPMQTYVDSLDSGDVAKINAFLNEAFGVGIGVDPGVITGDFITQTP